MLLELQQPLTSYNTAERRDMAGLREQVFVRKVIKLYDKYLAYVNDSFMNHTLLHKALKEAFEIFCNKGVAGSSSAELLATFSDNILKKVDSSPISSKKVQPKWIHHPSCPPHHFCLI